jgi:hypothetical protein
LKGNTDEKTVIVFSPSSDDETISAGMRAKREKNTYLSHCVISVFTVYPAVDQLKRD